MLYSRKENVTSESIMRATFAIPLVQMIGKIQTQRERLVHVQRRMCFIDAPLLHNIHPDIRDLHFGQRTKSITRR